METTKDKRAHAARVFKDMEDNLRRVGLMMQKLMRHPDTTQEQLIQASVSYRQLWLSYQETRAILRAKYPDNGVFTRLPWHEAGVP